MSYTKQRETLKEALMRDRDLLTTKSKEVNGADKTTLKSSKLSTKLRNEESL